MSTTTYAPSRRVNVVAGSFGTAPSHILNYVAGSAEFVARRELDPNAENTQGYQAAFSDRCQAAINALPEAQRKVTTKTGGGFFDGFWREVALEAFYLSHPSCAVRDISGQVVLVNHEIPNGVLIAFINPKTHTVRDYLSGWVPNSYKWPCKRTGIEYRKVNGEWEAAEFTYDAKRSGGHGPRFVARSEKGGTVR